MPAQVPSTGRPAANAARNGASSPLRWISMPIVVDSPPGITNPSTPERSSAVRTFTKALRYQCEDGAPSVRVMEAVMALVDTDMTAGRGTGKISPAQAAGEVIAAIKRDRDEVYVDRAKLLPILMRVAPGLGERLMRRG